MDIIQNDLLNNYDKFTANEKHKIDKNKEYCYIGSDKKISCGLLDSINNGYKFKNNPNSIQPIIYQKKPVPPNTSGGRRRKRTARRTRRRIKSRKTRSRRL